jgi:hypothetical protein
MKKILFFLVLFSALFTADASAQGNPTARIAEVKNDKVVIVASQNILVACFTQFEMFANSNPNTFELWTNEENQYFLTAKGAINGKEIIIKVDLEMRAGGYHTPFSPQGETCAGVNCSSCSFAKAGGCGCKNMENPTESGGGYCNHIITKP